MCNYNASTAANVYLSPNKPLAGGFNFDLNYSSGENMYKNKVIVLVFFLDFKVRLVILCSVHYKDKSGFKRSNYVEFRYNLPT